MCRKWPRKRPCMRRGQRAYRSSRENPPCDVPHNARIQIDRDSRTPRNVEHARAIGESRAHRLRFVPSVRLRSRRPVGKRHRATVRGFVGSRIVDLGQVRSAVSRPIAPNHTTASSMFSFCVLRDLSAGFRSSSRCCGRTGFSGDQGGACPSRQGRQFAPVGQGRGPHGLPRAGRRNRARRRQPGHGHRIPHLGRQRRPARQSSRLGVAQRRMTMSKVAKVREEHDVERPV
jgi:hypothetical protein